MTLKELFKIISEDLNIHSGKSFLKKILIIVFNMPFRLVLNYRLGYFLATKRNALNNIIILILKKRQIKYTNCDISYHAKIGRRIKFPHPLSIVIGDKSIIGNDVMIWQEVTLGSHGKNNSSAKYPIIGNNVKLFSGCKIIGGVKVNDNVTVGANAVVLKDVPSDHYTVGIPAINKYKSNN